jgi:hypothetical protein
VNEEEVKRSCEREGQLLVSRLHQQTPALAVAAGHLRHVSTERIAWSLPPLQVTLDGPEVVVSPANGAVRVITPLSFRWVRRSPRACPGLLLHFQLAREKERNHASRYADDETPDPLPARKRHLRRIT